MKSIGKQLRLHQPKSVGHKVQQELLLMSVEHIEHIEI